MKGLLFLSSARKRAKEAASHSAALIASFRVVSMAVNACLICAAVGKARGVAPLS